MPCHFHGFLGSFRSVASLHGWGVTELRDGVSRSNARAGRELGAFAGGYFTFAGVLPPGRSPSGSSAASLAEGFHGRHLARRGEACPWFPSLLMGSFPNGNPVVKRLPPIGSWSKSRSVWGASDFR